MFIGHFAVGLAAKKAAPKPSLGTYFIAVSFLDLVWPVFLLLGIERVEIDPGNTAFTPLKFLSYPYSHSLLMTAVWGILFSSVYYALRRDRQGTAWLFFAVVSHWVLNAITHRPDLQLYPGSNQFVGLGLWNSRTGTMIVEGMMFVTGVLLYSRSTKAKDRTGTVSFWSLMILLAVSYLGDAFGPPPPSAQFLAWFGFAAWVFVSWAYWVNRHRVQRITSAAAVRLQSQDKTDLSTGVSSHVRMNVSVLHVWIRAGDHDCG